MVGVSIFGEGLGLIGIRFVPVVHIFGQWVGFDTEHIINHDPGIIGTSDTFKNDSVIIFLAGFASLTAGGRVFLFTFTTLDDHFIFGIGLLFALVASFVG